MPLQKRFDSAPYYDDYNESKDYYKVLFKPGVAVQARELNQLQTMLQRQIERFGDHVFKSGTIVSGVNFAYNPSIAYAKILDTDTDGRPVALSSYAGLLARDSANLVARVVTTRDGFESKNPDLNTLYLEYLNSGTSQNATSFSNSSVLTIYSTSYPLYSITISNPGKDFANSDDVVITSPVRVLLLSNTKFQNTETITQATTGAVLEIVETIDEANAQYQVLRVKPVNADLANTLQAESKWTLQTTYNIAGGTSSATGRVEQIMGSGARGIATTDALGIIRTVTVASAGSGYQYTPHVTVRPLATPTADLENLSLLARNYKAKVTVAGSSFSAPTGFGYSFGVTEGVIYQKGYFSRVSPRIIIVEPYSNQPDGVVVGLTTVESNVSATTDSSLYDNASNTTNYRAPGADRLKLTPTLKVVSNTVATGNTSFFPLVEFQGGSPSREYRDTQYSVIGREFERRTRETSGDFVIDPFVVTTKEIAGNTTHFNVLVDPGTAYIAGSRVKTVSNSYLPVAKETSSIARLNTVVTASYGNYVIVNEVGGNFDFKTGATVDLYDQACSFLTQQSFSSVAALGTKIGTARVRSFVHDNGDQGQPATTYRMYLFDINMDAGQVFESVKSLFYNGTNKGICDIVQSFVTTANGERTTLRDSKLVDAVFDLGVEGVSSISNVSYNYRTSNESLTIATTGTFSISAPSGSEFPYAAGHTLSTLEKQDFSLIPLANLVGSANLVSANVGTSSSLIQTGSSQVGTVQTGDYIGVYSNTTSYTVRRVQAVNTSTITVASNVGFTNTSTNIVRVFPKFVPINLGRSTVAIATRSGSGGNATVDVNLGVTIASSQSLVGFYSIHIPVATRVSKDVNRQKYVKINTSTHTAGGTGPWCLGVPDIIRLRAVYEGTSTSGTNVTRHFFIDNGGRGESYKLGQLVKDPLSSYSASGKTLLVEFDSFTPSSGLEGFFTINSYPLNDSANLSASSTTINTLEIPELSTTRGLYYDLRNCFDFRPIASNTAILTSTPASATVNPSNTYTLNSDEKYFPVPGSSIIFDSSVYQSRVDSIIVRKTGDFAVLNGVATDMPAISKAPTAEVQSLLLNRLAVPKYPALPRILSAQTQQFADRRVGNDRGVVNVRTGRYNIKTINDGQMGAGVQPRGYSMSRIGAIERRVQVLEQYVTLSQRENAIKNVSIASSVDPTKQRFKNGFFVDVFDKNTSANYQSKEYNASIYPGVSALFPATTPRALSMKIDTTDTATVAGVYQKALMLPFVEEAVISFAVGTVPYVPPAPSASPIPITPSPSISRIPLSASAIPESPNPSPTPSPSITPSSTPTPSPTLTPGASATPTPSPSPTPSASITPTPSPTPTISGTPLPSPAPGASPTPSPSPTPTASPTPSPTPTASPTPSPSVTPPVTPTPSPSITITPSPTPSHSAPISPSPTPSPTVTPSNTPPMSPAAPSPSPSISPSRIVTGGGVITGDVHGIYWGTVGPETFTSTITSGNNDKTGVVEIWQDPEDFINDPDLTDVARYDDGSIVTTQTQTFDDGSTLTITNNYQGRPDASDGDVSLVSTIVTSTPATDSSSSSTTNSSWDWYDAGGDDLSFGGGCPDPQTPIMISPTESKPAGELKVGDIIYTMHETLRTYGYYKVLNAEIVQQPKLRFVFDDDTSIVVSTTHRFLMSSDQWEFAFKQNAGDIIKGVDGNKTIARVEPVEEGSVVKFEIEDAHTYISGSLISHNVKNSGDYWSWINEA